MPLNILRGDVVLLLQLFNELTERFKLPLLWKLFTEITSQYNLDGLVIDGLIHGTTWLLDEVSDLFPFPCGANEDVIADMLMREGTLFVALGTVRVLDCLELLWHVRRCYASVVDYNVPRNERGKC